MLYVKKKEILKSLYFTYFSIILYDFVNCLAFVGIKQTLHYEVAIE